MPVMGKRSRHLFLTRNCSEAQIKQVLFMDGLDSYSLNS